MNKLCWNSIWHKTATKIFRSIFSKDYFQCLSNLHDRQMMFSVEFDLFNLKVAHFTLMLSVVFITAFWDQDYIFQENRIISMANKTSPQVTQKYVKWWIMTFTIEKAPTFQKSIERHPSRNPSELYQLTFFLTFKSSNFTIISLTLFYLIPSNCSLM